MKKLILLIVPLIVCALMSFPAAASSEEPRQPDAIVINPNDLWQVILAISGGIITLAGAGAVINGIVQKAKAPNVKQNERLTALESGLKDTNVKIDDEVGKINARLELGNRRFQSDAEKTCALENAMKESNKVIIESLQALTAHAIDGNNTDKLRASEEALNDYLRSKL